MDNCPDAQGVDCDDIVGVYKYLNNSWIQVGQFLNRTWDFDYLPISLNHDGTIIAGEEIVSAGAMDDLRITGAMPSYDRLLETGYNTLISKPSNWLNRDPLFRRSFSSFNANCLL